MDEALDLSALVRRMWEMVRTDADRDELLGKYRDELRQAGVDPYEPCRTLSDRAAMKEALSDPVAMKDEVYAAIRRIRTGTA